MRVHLDITNYGQLICSVVIDHPNPSPGARVSVDFGDESAIGLQKTEFWREPDESLTYDPSLLFDGAYCFEIDSGELREDVYFARTEMQMDRPTQEDLEEGGGDEVF